MTKHIRRYVPGLNSTLYLKRTAVGEGRAEYRNLHHNVLDVPVHNGVHTATAGRLVVQPPDMLI
jgi:hypothetical protein